MKQSTKVFLFLSTFLAISDIAFVRLNYLSSKSALELSVNTESEHIQTRFYQALAATEDRMLQIAAFVGADTAVQQLFLAGVRSVTREGGGAGGSDAMLARLKLYERVAASRDALAKNYDFRQLHFHLGPGSTSFLRAHRPEKYGDNMDDVRHTIVATNQEKITSSGFETGRVYSGIRGVVPVYAWDHNLDNQVYAGALEAGTSFQTTLTSIAKSSSLNIAVLLSESHMRDNVWPEFLNTKLRKTPFIRSYLVEATTDSLISTIMSHNFQIIGKSQKYPDFLYMVDQTSLVITAFPLRDFLGKSLQERDDVGYIVTWRDKSSEIAAFKQSLNINILFALFGYLIVEILLYLGIHFATTKLALAVDEGKQEISLLLQKAEKSEEHYRTIADYSYDWEWWTSPDNKYLHVSPSVERITGYKPQEFFKDSDLLMKLIHPNDLAYYKSNNISDTPSIKGTSTYRIITKDGEERWIGSECNRIISTQGEYLGLRGSSRDISEHVSLEKKLRESENLRAIGTMVGGVAHEFNNALQSLLLYAGLVKDQLPEEQAIKGDFEHMLGTANDAKHLVEQVMLISSRNSGQPEPVNLPELINDVLEQKMTDGLNM